MDTNTKWIRKRWLDGRMGTSGYLLFAIAMVNFVIIAYRFLIEQDPVFEELVPNLWMFAIIFIIFYIPASILIGRWHNLTQVKVETTIKVLEEAIPAKMFRIILDVQTGKASKEEIEEIEKMIKDIEKV